MLQKLSIGTAQFGLDYGISNNTGQVNLTEATKILEYAKKKNISTLDTAFQYGNSEKIIGKIIKPNSWNIITKTSPLLTKKLDIQNIIKNFHLSLKELNQTSIYGLLIHDIHLINNPDFPLLYEELIKLKNTNYIKKLGFSVYNQEQINLILDNFNPDIIQLPINLFDQTLLKNSILKKIKNYNVEIHARSIFLQGLLLTKAKNLPTYFLQWESDFLQYHHYLEEVNLTPLQACLQFALQISEIDKVIIGCQSLEQLKEIILASKPSLQHDFSILHNTNNKLTDPRKWEN